MTKAALTLSALLLLCSACSIAQPVRHANLASSLPISTAVEVDGLLFHSGVIPSPANPQLERSDSGYWGNTQQQTQSVLEKIRVSLEEKGYAMGDVIKMTVFLVAPAGQQGMDFSGFMAAYTEYFGEASAGLLPARSVVEVAGLVAPGMLVEIEVIAAKSN